MFITFEGGEGAGKTTQINLLKNYLEAKGQDVVLTREPGGTPEAEKIRDLLVQRDGGDWTPKAEALLFFTARHMHVEKLIKPALNEGKTVICDRFTDSTIAYQGYGHGFDLDILDQIQRLTIGDFTPDKTFILDIDVKDGLMRAGKRMEGDDDGTTEDRFERMDLSFHENLRQGFLTLVKQDPDRYGVINAAQSIDDVHAAIVASLENGGLL
jgi:dTMP kinase